MKKLLKFLFATVFTLGIVFPNVNAVEVVNITAKLTVSESRVIKPSDKAMLGIGHEWGDTWQVKQSDKAVLDMSDEFAQITTQSDLPLPLMRLAGGSSQWFEWQESLGTIDERGYWEDGKKLYFGLGEMLKSTLDVTKDAQFIFTVNLKSETKHMENLVRFLTLNPDDENACDADGFNWPLYRQEFGFYEPINMFAFELGNETDAGCSLANSTVVKENAMSYVAMCNRAMDAMRPINPNIKFAAHSKSYPEEDPVMGSLWNRTVIESIGTKVAYISYHQYFHVRGNFWGVEAWRLNDEITTHLNRIDASVRPKIIFTEYANWADPDGDNTTNQFKKSTAALQGTLTVAEFLNRMTIRTDVAAATYFCIRSHGATMENYNSCPFCVARNYTNGDTYMTGVGELFKMLHYAYGKDVVKTSFVSNPSTYTDRPCDYGVNGFYGGRLTCTSHTTEDGGLNLVIVNQDEKIKVDISFSAEKDYKLETELVLTAEDNLAENTPATPEGLHRKINVVNSEEKFTGHTILPQSVTVLKLVPMEKQHPQEFMGEIKFKDAGDFNGQPHITGDSVEFVYNAYANKAFADKAEMVAFIMKSDDSVTGNIYEDIIGSMAFEQSKLNCDVAYFNIKMPQTAKEGNYKIMLSSDNVLEEREFYYTPQNGVSVKDAYFNPQTSQINIDFAQSVPAGTPFIAKIISKHGGVAYYDEHSVSSQNQIVDVKMPPEAEKGVYELVINCNSKIGTADTFKKEFEFVPQRKYYLSDKISYENGTYTIPVFAGVENATEAKIIAASYDAKGVLVNSQISDAKLVPGENAPTIGFAQGEFVRLFIWDASSFEPLDFAYEPASAANRGEVNYDE